MSAIEERKIAEGIAVHVHKFARDTAKLSAGPGNNGKSGVLEIINLYQSLGKNANKKNSDLRDKELRKLLKIARVPKELLGKKGKVSKLPKSVISVLRTIILAASKKRSSRLPPSDVLTSKEFLRWVKSPPIAAATERGSKTPEPQSVEQPKKVSSEKEKFSFARATRSSSV